MDARLRDGIGLFNAGRFFESHESLEQFYQAAEEADKPFLEGLIELAVAFRLYNDFGEIRGPVRMIYQALIRFENYQTTYLDVHVKDLSEAMEAWAKVADSGDKPLAPIPKIPVQGFGTACS